VTFDFNRITLCDEPISLLINELIERAELPSENHRQYLGASTIGFECMRKIKYDWFCTARYAARIKDVFVRGHSAEEIARNHKAIARDGLTGLYSPYAAQVAVYQAYLKVTEHPALFTVTNANTCERLHFLVPFDGVLAQWASDRAVTIIEASCAGELLPRITEDQNDWRCRVCGHRGRCWSPC
jgi:hypothetical protein